MPCGAPWHSAEPCPVAAVTFLTSFRHATRASHGGKNNGMQRHQKDLAQLQCRLNEPHKGENSLSSDLHLYISVSDFAWPV